MSKVIIALDFKSRDEIRNFLDKFGSEKLYVKVGMEAFYGQGPELLADLNKRGHQIFLDLKCHDIPNTVKACMAQLARLDVDMVNVHASGGIAMMKAAMEGLKTGNGKRPLCIAVTCLTSLDDETLSEELWIDHPVKEVAAHWAENARAAGLDGVVCSPLEAKSIHERCGDDFLCVTPGIRQAGDDVNDQKRVTTASMARELTSDYIVVGRSITAAKDPLAVYQQIKKEFEGE